MDRAGVFHRLPHLDDARLAEIFAREVLGLLVGPISRPLRSLATGSQVLCSRRRPGYSLL
jgi:hypothetical protein